MIFETVGRDAFRNVRIIASVHVYYVIERCSPDHISDLFIFDGLVTRFEKTLYRVIFTCIKLRRLVWFFYTSDIRLCISDWH